MTSASMLFKVVKDPQPGRPQAIAVVRGGKKTPCSTLEDYLQEVVKVFYDEGGEYADALQTIARLSMQINEQATGKLGSEKRSKPQVFRFSTSNAQPPPVTRKTDSQKSAKRM